MGDDDHLYRRGVGVMLLNRDGKVFVAARVDNPDDAWQMPQGGIDADEEPLRYDIPEEWRPRHWDGKWKGQRQHWFLARFLGRDEDVSLDTEHPEFRAWKWVEPEQVPELIVPFKRELYERLLQDFRAWL